jgi:hypothetical protein
MELRELRERVKGVRRVKGELFITEDQGVREDEGDFL